MRTMRGMAGLLASAMISASYNRDISFTRTSKIQLYKAVDGSKPTKKRTKVKLSRKANLQRIRNER